MKDDHPRYTAALAIAAAVLLFLAPAPAHAAGSSVIQVPVGRELVPCPAGGRVLSVRELDTGLRLVREPRPELYLRRVNPLLRAERAWELDRRDPDVRGSVRYYAHTAGAELLNAAPAPIGVRVVCDR